MSNRYIEILWNDKAFTELLQAAAKVLKEVANGTEINRDFTKRQSVTKDVARVSKLERSKAKGHDWYIATAK